MLTNKQLLGDVVKQAREALGLTQKDVAEFLNVDSRTILNIENYKGNPKFEILHPLIRILRIDARKIFNPELQHGTPATIYVNEMIASCSEQELCALIPIIEAVLSTLRHRDIPETE